MTTDAYVDAVEYVGTTPLSGFAQLALLHRLGLRRSDRVLEIGAGALHLAKPLLCSLWARYYGIDPNSWLRDAARDADPVLDELCVGSGARFSTRTDFDGKAAFGARFDVVFSHSVLSHASRAQIISFMAAVAGMLTPDGWALVSLNLVDVDETIGDEWVYPGCVNALRSGIDSAVTAAGLVWDERPELRELYRSWCPDETHDWIRVRRG